MESATAVRCPGCGYENNPFYRYCGMCGNPLRAGEPPLPVVPVPPPAPRMPEPSPAITQPAPFAQGLVTKSPPRKARPLTINGFSILGLSDDLPIEEAPTLEPRDEATGEEQRRYQDQPYYGSNPYLAPSGSVQYLLEDDEPDGRVHWRMYIALALLAVAAGALVWHWQTNGYPWEAVVREREARGAAKAAQLAEAAAPVDPGVAMPAKPSPSTTTSEPPREMTPPAQKTDEPASQPAPEGESTPSGAPSSPPREAVAPAASTPIEPEPAPKAEAAVPAKKPAVPAIEPTSLPEPSSAAATDPAHLFTEGEKYLYGDGVPQDCDRAQKDLRTSATHSYPQAESLLATMYASGHCLGRDLPAAYRWYARALRHEPGNTRISSDLQVLWGQMTVAERKAAQSSGQ
jgi:outer membrane biosynthesis protein TonB